MAVGELFLISGIIALIAYWYARKHSGDYVVTDQKGRIISGGQPTFPIVGPYHFRRSAHVPHSRGG